eukprot:2432041-Amphidinium_carterae.1
MKFKWTTAFRQGYGVIVRNMGQGNGAPGVEALRILLGLATVYNHAAICSDFSGAFMYTPMVGEDLYIEPPQEAVPNLNHAWKLKKPSRRRRMA